MVFVCVCMCAWVCVCLKTLYHHHHGAAVMSSSWTKASACCVQTGQCCTTRLVRLSVILSVFSRSFPVVSCHSVNSYSADVPCPGHPASSALFNHDSDLCLLSYPYVCFPVPVFVMFNIFLLSLFVRLIECSLLGW